MVFKKKKDILLWINFLKKGKLISNYKKDNNNNNNKNIIIKIILLLKPSKEEKLLNQRTKSLELNN